MSGVRIISLCEDLQTDVFVRCFLRRRFPRREFRPLVPPPGSQSGEQWVREQYPDRRNIETWFAYLGGATVDEEAEYPRLQRERDCDPHANRLYAMCHEAQRLDEGAPPSLREACEEYGRLRP